MSRSYVFFVIGVRVTHESSKEVEGDLDRQGIERNTILSDDNSDLEEDRFVEKPLADPEWTAKHEEEVINPLENYKK